MTTYELHLTAWYADTPRRHAWITYCYQGLPRTPNIHLASYAVAGAIPGTSPHAERRT